MADEKTLSSERSVRFSNKKGRGFKQSARSGTQLGVIRGWLCMSFLILVLSCCVHIFFPHLLALPNYFVEREIRPLGMLVHQRLGGKASREIVVLPYHTNPLTLFSPIEIITDANFASNITALHERSVELLRTGQYWEGRKLDLDDAVPNRARAINASWLEGNPGVTINSTCNLLSQSAPGRLLRLDSFVYSRCHCLVVVLLVCTRQEKSHLSYYADIPSQTIAQIKIDPVSTLHLFYTTRTRATLFSVSF